MRISLDSIDAKGQESDVWYKVEGEGRMKAVSGEVRVKCRFSCPPTDRDIDIDLEAGKPINQIRKSYLCDNLLALCGS